jgi:class 3 adenylate cyclase
MSTSPSPTAEEQSAAPVIVFTDVTGFSTRLEEDKVGALALLERDFVAMRYFIKTHSGTVVKTTGDGLMIHFPTAGDAVEWAVKTQRHLADQAAVMASKDVLRHRIGIHSGDVSISSGQLLGDGVDIAARAQAEAKPGGICISQAVFDLVKNKLKLGFVQLEPRKVKNILEPVVMYHVLIDQPALRAAPPSENKRSSAKTTTGEKKSSALPRSTILIAAIVAGILAAGVYFYQAYLDHQNSLVNNRQMRDKFGAALQSEKKEETPAPLATNPAQVVAAPGPVESAPVKPVVAEPNFLKMTTHNPAVAGVSPEQDRVLQRALECIQAMEKWRVEELQRYPKELPLVVRPLRGSTPQAWKVFTDSNHELNFGEGGASRKRPWSELKPEVQGAIIASLLPKTTVPREVVLGAEAFAFVHGLPELAALLVRE